MFAYDVQCVMDQLDQKEKEREREAKNEHCVAHWSKRTNRERKESTKNDYVSGQFS
jgi:hypothetical protein